MEFLHTNRVIVLVDMDCFYCQVEEKLNPRLIGKPIAVVQYNAWRGGGIIAVNYPARDMGVTRHMRGNEAKEKCPDIELVSVPTLREKADLSKYRDAGKEVASVLQLYTELLERASVDEAYMDITDAVNKRIENSHPITIDKLKNTHVVGFETADFIDNLKYEHCLESNRRLCMGGVIAEEIRKAIFEKTGYKCSAGIAHNKILAKLACGLHKPNQQTILPQDGVDGLFATLPLRKIRSLGGKFGNDLGEDLGIKTMGELQKFSEKDLINRYDEKTGTWLYRIARGIDLEPVTVRLVSKSIGCCKKFPGRTALVCSEDVQHWINELSIEISDRLHKDMEENCRKAKHMVVGFVQEIKKKDISASRTHPLNSYEPGKIAADMLKVVEKHCLNSDGFYRIKYLGISAGKFEDCKKGYDITSYFKNTDKHVKASSEKVECNLPYFFSKMQKDVHASDPNENNESFARVSNERNENLLHNNLEEDNLLNECHTQLTELRNNIDTNENILNDLDKEDNGENNKSSYSDSVFSQDTIVMDIDEGNLVYNEDYKSIEGFFKDSISKDNKDSETDSITDEITNSCEKDVLEESTSYFSSYFNNIKPHDRNFDTSRHLEEDDSNLESESSSAESSERSTSKDSSSVPALEGVEDTTENYQTKTAGEEVKSNTNDSFCNSNLLYIKSYEEAFNDDRKERCKECDRLILKSEMTSHLDYHFAIQIVRNEAHLYNSNIPAPDPPKKSVEVKQTKRKRCDVTSAKLTEFFQNKEEVSCDTPTETCPQCSKRVACDEFSNHLDYHVAKKLHSEINPVVKSSVKVSKVVTKKQAVKGNKPESVIKFFKNSM